MGPPLRAPRRRTPGSTQSQPSTSSSQSSTSTSSQRSSSSGSDPKALNDRGFALIQQGNPTAAVEPLQGAVKGFRNQDRTDEIDYAFALFNLGNSLRLIGRPAEAIPFLEERLEVSDYKRGVVRRELALARQQAGQPASGNGNGDGDGRRLTVRSGEAGLPRMSIRSPESETADRADPQGMVTPKVTEQRRGSAHGGTAGGQAAGTPAGASSASR